MSSTYLPLITILKASLEEEADIIQWVIQHGRLYSKKQVYSRFTELSETNSKETSRELVFQTLQEVHAENSIRLNQQVQVLQKKWKQVQKGFLVSLSVVLDTSWPKNKDIDAHASIVPVCPRDLNTWTFYVDINGSVQTSIEIMTHEICHFLYFEKLRESFPDIPKDHYESPHVEWVLSEMLAPIILHDDRLQRVFQQPIRYFPDHTKLAIGKDSVTGLLEQLYLKHVQKSTSFKELLRECSDLLGSIKREEKYRQ